MRRAALLAALLLGLPHLVVPRPVSEGDLDRYYASASATETMYVCLLGNGTYERWLRMHLAVLRSDRGTWSRSEDGGLVLLSDVRVEDVAFGSLSIDVGTRSDFDLLRELREKIVAFLDRHPDAAELAALDVWRVKIEMKRRIFGINLRSGDRPVQRADLKGLVDEISAYLSREDHRQRVYAEILVTGAQEVLALAGSPEEARTKVRGGRGTKYVRIDRERFEEELRTTQPFLFHRPGQRRVEE
jgi:hypothetical protein